MDFFFFFIFFAHWGAVLVLTFHCDSIVPEEKVHVTFSSVSERLIIVVFVSQNKDQRAYKAQFSFLTAAQDASAFWLKELRSPINKIVFTLQMFRDVQAMQ